MGQSSSSRYGELNNSWNISVSLILQAHWKAMVLMNGIEGLVFSWFLI